MTTIKSAFTTMLVFILFTAVQPVLAEGDIIVCGKKVSEIKEIDQTIPELTEFYNKLNFDVNVCALGNRSAIVISKDVDTSSEISKAIIPK